MSLYKGEQKVLNSLVSVPITQTIDSSSTETDVPSAKAVYANLGEKADKNNAVVKALKIEATNGTSQIIPWIDGTHYRSIDGNNGNDYTDIITKDGTAHLVKVKNGGAIKDEELATMDKIDELNANRQVKTFNNGNSTAKYYKICSAITAGYPYNIKATAGRIDTTVRVEYFSAIFRDSKYNYTSQVVSDGRFIYNQSVSTNKEYCSYFIVDANQDLYLYVPSYTKITIEIDTRAITIDGTEGTPVKDYVYNSFDHRFDGRINDSSTNTSSTWSSSKIASMLGGLTFSVSGTNLVVTDGKNTWTIAANS